LRLDDALADPRRYERELERLAARLPPRRLRGVTQDGVPISVLTAERGRVARLMARAVAEGTYRTTPAVVRLARLDKERALFVFSAADLVLHGVIAGLIAEASEPRLSTRVFSYRRGRSSLAAVRQLARAARRHAAARPDPRERGLYVVHCDVESFGDSVPLAPDAPLWAALRGVLGDGQTWPLVEACVRPPIAADGPAEAWRGLPTGSPIVPPIANLYLGPVDRALEALPGGFYVRYGDDLLFAHAEADVAGAALERIDATLAALRLRVNPKKRRLLFWNGAGRPSAAWPGATSIDALGLRVAWDGTIGLPRRKLREVLVDARARAVRSRALLPAGARGPAVAAAVAAALDPSSPFAHAYAGLLRAVVTDRRQLAQLDHLLALAVAAAAGERPGVRAFREAPPRQLRAWGLPSLVDARNRWRTR